MKKIVLSLLLILAMYSGYSQSLLKEMQLNAKKENKLILLNFSGSDWCIPCIKMQKDYFENEDFRKLADSQLLIIRADFPRKKKNLPAAAIVKENEWLADKFNPDGGFPLTLLLDENGNVLKRWSGLPEESVAAFTKNIRALVQKNEP